MDPEPASVSKTPFNFEVSSKSSHQEDLIGIDDEDPVSLSGPSIALLGLTIAIATVGIPLAAVLTERQMGRESMVPTALKSYGSKSSPSISYSRSSQLGSGNSSR